MRNYFKVSVIDCNRDTFLYHYDEYVIGEERLPYGDSLFTMVATEEMYDEIKTLKEEGIEIVEENNNNNMNSYDEMVSICKNIAEEYNTMFETRDYSEYGWASLSFMTDKFGGTYMNIHYDHMTGEMINWYGSKDAEKIESVTQLRRLVKYYMEKELKARDFDALSDFINSQY